MAFAPNTIQNRKRTASADAARRRRSLTEWLLDRTGAQFILLMMIVTRFAAAVGGLLIKYYIELMLHMSPAMRRDFRLLSLAVIGFTLTLTTSIALWRTRKLRLVLRKLKHGEWIQPEESHAAGREAVTFNARQHCIEAVVITLTCILPVLAMLYYVHDAGYDLLVNLTLASFMAVSTAMMGTFFTVEHFMKPVIRKVLASGISIDYRTLPVGRMRTRFTLCFAIIISNTALLIGTLARQRAVDIINNPREQQAAVDDLVEQSTIITAIAVAMGLTLSGVLANSVAGRLNQLVEGMEGVSRGELSDRVIPTGNDEVDTLGRQFNAMVARLDRDHRTIRELNATLEQKVNLRTGQLEKTVNQLRDTQETLTQYNRRLEAARQEAEAASNAKGDFLANISHELRTPLNGVIGMTELLLETALDARQRKFAETVKSSGTSLLQLLNDVLDFSKIEAGKLELEQIEFNLQEVIEPVIEAAAYRCRDKNVEVATFIDPALPQILVGDPGRIRQVINNLVNNAVKFTESGSVLVYASVMDRSDMKVRVQFRVLDTGIGIPDDRFDRLFHSFSQVDASTTRKFGGTGLGLAICKQLCELMNGEIDVESEDGAGSVFSFWVPLEISEKDSTQPMLPAEADAAAALVIDDNGGTNKTLAAQLGAWGLVVDTADSLEDGWKLALRRADEDQPFRLVYIDGELPGIDPVEFAGRFARPEFEKPSLMVLMPMGSRCDIGEILAAGYSDFVMKPVVPTSLLNATAAALSGKSQSRDIHSALVKRKQSRLLPRTKHADSQILLAEDNEINQEVAIQVLERLGHTVTVVVNGREAIDALETKRFDLVLMDCQMPEMDGLTATREIRRREGEDQFPYKGSMPIVALTANVLAGEREQCLSAGMNDYLSKPLDPPKLAGVIEAALEISGLDYSGFVEPAEKEEEETSNSPFSSLSSKAPPEPIEETGPVVVDREATELVTHIDYQSLLDRCLGNDSLAGRLMAKFDDKAQEELDEITKALARRDAETLATRAHSLKGAAGNISAYKVRDLAASLEAAAKDGQLDGCDAVLVALQREIRKLRRDIAVLTGAEVVSETDDSVQNSNTGEVACVS